MPSRWIRDYADAHYKLAQAAMRLGDGRTAVQELLTTVQIRPDYYAAHLDLANLLVLAHQFTDAKQHLDLLAQKQPNNPDVYIARARYDAAINNTTAALADMQKAVQLDPKRADSFLNLGVLEVQSQQWDAAEANFKKSRRSRSQIDECAHYARKFLPDPGPLS